MRESARLRIAGPGLAPGPAPLVAAFLTAWLLLPWSASPALAHGVVMHQFQRQAAVATTEYESGEPMAFAKVRVLDPQGKTYQVGNADALGRFAWLPDRPGPWQVAMEDGMGHRGELIINTDQTGVPQQAPPTETLRDVPLLYRVMWGLSVIFGLSGLGFWWSGRRKRIHLRPRR